jgi:hypothetical protein
MVERFACGGCLSCPPELWLAAGEGDLYRQIARLEDSQSQQNGDVMPRVAMAAAVADRVVATTHRDL